MDGPDAAQEPQGQTLMVIFSLGGVHMAGHVRPRAVRCQPAFVPLQGEPQVVLDPFPEKGHRGTVEGGQVRIGPGDARPLAAAARGGRWDDLDLAAFAARQLWAWVALPLVLARPEVSVRAAGHRRLEVTVPAQWPAPPGPHVLHLDGDDLVVRHEEAGGLVHELIEHCEFSGVPVATRRRTRGRGGVTVLWADVVAAAVHPSVAQKPLN